MSSKFLQLQQKYLSSFDKKAKDIELAWQKNNYDELKEFAHKLAGSSGGYGFTEISILSRQVIDLIQTTSKHDVKLLDKKVTSLISSLKQHKK